MVGLPRAPEYPWGEGGAHGEQTISRARTHVRLGANCTLYVQLIVRHLHLRRAVFKKDECGHETKCTQLVLVRALVLLAPKAGMVGSGRDTSLPCVIVAQAAVAGDAHVRGIGGDSYIPEEAGSIFSIHKPLPSHQGPFGLINCLVQFTEWLRRDLEEVLTSQKQAGCSAPPRPKAKSS